jgi:uncharacterized membrane protein HdeD (DUF308 family)
MEFGLARNWWVLALRGILAILFGILAILWPDITVGVLVFLFGAFALVNGIFAIVAVVTGAAAQEGRQWWALLVEGLLGIGAGAVTFLWPGITALALIYVIAFWAILAGVFEVMAAIRLRKQIEGEWVLALSGILSILFGGLLIVWPAEGIRAVIWLIGAYAIGFGLLLLALAFRLRSLGRRGSEVRG